MWVIIGLRIKPFLRSSRTVVTLRKRPQTPISLTGSSLTMKKIFQKPKKTITSRFNKENAPLLYQCDENENAKSLGF
jgi:hypothetical protein